MSQVAELRVAAAPPATPVAARAKGRGPSTRSVLAVGGALAVAAGGAAFILAPRSSESTDAAYVEADSSVVAPKVRGLVAEVLVRHNQPVRRGEPLVRIDPEEFDAKVASATADLAMARAAVAAGRANLSSLGAEEGLADANIRAAETLIGAADAENVRAAADDARYQRLVALGAASRADGDRSRAAAASAASEAAHSRAALAVSRSEAAATRAKRAAVLAGLAEAQAQVARAEAALDLARQDQANALVRAPIDGVVADREAEPGDYVQPGTRLVTIVPLNAVYVTANFKETQVGRITMGQPAVIKVDALPGRAFKGVVDSIAPGSGTQFSLLPFEPGTGNFTKIVQRVPVRIRFQPGQDLSALRPGLSTTVRVALTEEKP